MMPPTDKPHQTMTFSGCIDSFCNASLADLHSKIDNPVYLRIHWAKNELHSWTQFFDKEVNLQPTFQELIHQKFYITVGRSASILAPAVFWKASYRNLSVKFITLLTNRGPIAVYRQWIDNWWSSFTLADKAAIFSSVRTLRKLVGGLMSNKMKIWCEI